MKELKNIMVAVDFNDSVGDLLGYAEGLAEKFDSKIWVVYVADPATGKSDGKDVLGPDPGKLAEDRQNLKSLCDAFLSEEIEWEHLVIEGSTVEMVLEEAKELNTELLVVGTHKHSFLHNLISESVSLQLFRKANIPLLAIPFDEE